MECAVSSRNKEKRRAKRAQRARQQTHEHGDSGGGHGGDGGSSRGDSGHGGDARVRPDGPDSQENPFAAPRPSLSELAEPLIVMAVTARHERSHRFEELLDDLATFGGASADAVRAVDLAVLRLLRRAIGFQWPHGWQPADLVRCVVREYGARHGRLAGDGICAQLRGYSPETVDERWDAQLRALDASVWWDDDATYLSQWVLKERIDRTQALRTAVEVLVVVGGLPMLPMLGDPPGKARRGSLNRDASASGAEADQRILAKIRALLAKAESTTFPDEAEAYSAKAQELMARHSIDYALLAAATGGRHTPIGIRIGIDNPYESPKSTLLAEVAAANHCRAVWSTTLGFSTVVGHRADLDGVELLYTSLLVQATAAMLRQGSRTDGYGRSRTRSFRQSFLNAYAIRIGQRLRATTDDVSRSVAAEAGRQNLLPVLAGREHEVRRTVADMFPGMVTKQLTISNREGWVSGTAAADLASLGSRGALD
jgi:hypothetical protein